MFGSVTAFVGWICIGEVQGQKHAAHMRQACVGVLVRERERGEGERGERERGERKQVTSPLASTPPQTLGQTRVCGQATWKLAPKLAPKTVTMVPIASELVGDMLETTDGVFGVWGSRSRV